MKRRAFFKAMGLVGLTPFIAKGDASWEDDYWEDEEAGVYGFGEPAYAPPACAARFYASFKSAIVHDRRALEGPYYVQLVGPGYEFDIQHSTTADIVDRILGPMLMEVDVVNTYDLLSLNVRDELRFRFPPGYDGLISNAILSKPSGDLAACVTIGQQMVSGPQSVHGDTLTLRWDAALATIS